MILTRRSMSFLHCCHDFISLGSLVRYRDMYNLNDVVLNGLVGTSFVHVCLRL